jgi:nitrate reductase alpha subunit
MAVSYVVLKEFHYEKKNAYFIDYVKKYTDCPFLVKLEQVDGTLRPG